MLTLPAPTLLLLLLVLLMVPPPARADGPREVSATFGWLRNGQEVGRSVENLARSENRYFIESITEAVGVFSWFARGRLVSSSEGRVGPEGLLPETFSYQRGDRPERSLEARFRRQDGTVALQQGEEVRVEAIDPGCQDRLSLPYQFMFMAHPLPPRLDLCMVDGRRVARYQYRLLGPETIRSPIGELKTLRYRQQGTDDNEIKDLWLAVEHGYMAVRMLTREDDGTEETIVTSLDIRAP